jgi:hypothetical protein
MKLLAACLPFAERPRFKGFVLPPAELVDLWKPLPLFWCPITLELPMIGLLEEAGT